MKFKKLLTGFSILCMAATLFLPLSVSASESGTTSLTTTVPDTHNVELVIKGNGTVKADKQEYKTSQTIQIPRLSQLTYEFVADEGWQLESVSYGKEGSVKEVALTGTSFMPEEVYEDGYTLHVVFAEKGKTGTDGTNKGDNIQVGADGTNKSDNVQTGDQTNVVFWEVLLMGSTVAVCSLSKKKRKTNH